MQFNCIYSTGTRYGLRQTSKHYKARVIPDKKGVRVDYSFPHGAGGLSGGSGSRVNAMSLSLNREEILQLATAIMTALHHPTHDGMPVIWTTEGAMRPQQKADWGTTLHITPHATATAVIIDNQTDMQIGIVKMDITCADHQDERFTFPVVTESINLSPGAKQVVDVDDAIKEHHQYHYLCRVISVDVKGVTGAKNYPIKYGQDQGVCLA